MAARADRPYPPDWCDDDTMAYLLDMGKSTFRDYVNRGLLPKGRRIGGSVRWSRHEVTRALADLGGPAQTRERSDPIMEAARGKKEAARRGTA